MEACDRIHSRDNEVTVRWVLAHSGAQGNEKADQFAKVATARAAPGSDEVTDEQRWETYNILYF